MTRSLPLLAARLVLLLATAALLLVCEGLSPLSSSAPAGATEPTLKHGTIPDAVRKRLELLEWMKARETKL
jgi:hypothetical protein